MTLLQVSVQVGVAPQPKIGLLTQLPVAASQLSVVQAFASSQLFATPALQRPPLQKSPVVHRLLSLQAAALLA